MEAVYQGFRAAKEAAARQLVESMTFNSMAIMVPWLPALIASDRALLGKDWWPYGLKANAAAVDAVLRYHHEQGITERRFTAEEIFVPFLLDS